MKDLNLEAVTALFQVADDDTVMEVIALVETLFTSRCGLYASGASTKVISNGEYLTINPVADSVQSKTALAKLRDNEYSRSRRNNVGPSPQEPEDRCQQRILVPASNDDVCPVQGCDFVLLPEKRYFGRPSNQWVCSTYIWRARENNNELRPDLRPRFARIEEAEAAAEKEDDTCGTSWCTNTMRDSTGKLNRHWRIRLQTHVCDTCGKKFPDDEMLETRPMKDKCYGICGKIGVNLTWDPKTRRWLCLSRYQLTRDGRLAYKVTTDGSLAYERRKTCSERVEQDFLQRRPAPMVLQKPRHGQLGNSSFQQIAMSKKEALSQRNPVARLLVREVILHFHNLMSSDRSTWERR